MKTKNIKIEGYTIGVKKRDRRAKQHKVFEDYLDKEKIEDVTQEEIQHYSEQIRMKVLEVKDHRDDRMVLTPVELDDGKDEHGNVIGMSSESYMMFSGKTIDL